MSTKPKRLRFEWKRKAGDRSGAGFVERKSCTEAVQIEMEIDRAQRLNRELNPYSERVPRLGGVRGGSCAEGKRNSAAQEAAALELYQAQRCHKAQPPQTNAVADRQRNNRKPSSVPRRQIIPYHPNLKLIARQLRNNSSPAEIQLWLKLKGKFHGKYDFHRQKPILDFIVDFYCYELSLAIEIDGKFHELPEVKENDQRKERNLRSVGVNLLRFTNEQVLYEMPWVLDTMICYIHAYESKKLSSLDLEKIPLKVFSKKS